MRPMVGGMVANPRAASSSTHGRVSSSIRNATRATAAPYQILDTGQTVSSDSVPSPQPIDQLVPRQLTFADLSGQQVATQARSSSVPAEGSMSARDWTLVQQNNVQNNVQMEVDQTTVNIEAHLHHNEHQQHDHFYDGRSVIVQQVVFGSNSGGCSGRSCGSGADGSSRGNIAA